MISTLHRKLIRDLLHMRGQMLAVTAVMACGIATYVTEQCAFRALVTAQSDYYAGYRFADVFAHLKRAPESLFNAILAIPGVASVQTRVVAEVTLDVPGLEEPATGRLVSIPERRMPMLNDLFLRQGRYIEPGQRGEVLVSEAFAEANRLQVGDRLGAVLNGKWEPLHIVGIALSPEYIYEIRPSEVFPDSRRFGVLWMSRDVLGPAFNMQDAFNDVAISLSRGANQPEVIARVDALLERYGGLGAYGREDQLSYRYLTDELAEIRTTAVILPTLFLGVVAFLLHVLLSRLVGTQRGQVAVLRAFGYRSSEIGIHYLQLALVAISLGAASGIALGYWIGQGLTGIYAQYFHFPVLQLRLDPQVLLLAAGISAASACLGALSAVRRAVALAPAEAMRPEAPATFRPGWLERFSLWTLLSPASRMIVRNLERRPWKAFFSALGVALAVSILVVGRFAIDSVERLVDVQFEKVQREDVMITFQEPR
ncbi:MAG TPA: FtsX-like permease family protein, partial [Bryobacteraceae bacterium]|nr:FtsX-like permease family protein [Bryobacteraceae bacterium]